MKCYNLFLDDERHPKDVMLYKPERIYIEKQWTVVRNYNQFLNKVSERYASGHLPCLISYDHDLAKEHYLQGAKNGFTSFDETIVTVPTGWHCLKWFLKFCETNDLALPKILMHSQNPAGIANMVSLIDEYNHKKKMPEEVEISALFDGEKSDQKNALITALTECGKDFAKSNKRHPHDNSFYDWLEKTQKKELINGIIDKLNELGYEIVKTVKN